MSNLNYREIGQRIRGLRREHRLKQAQLAAVIYVSINHMGHIESGDKPVQLDMLVTLAEYFGVSLDYLVLGKR